jgi:hypothetical protein
VLYLKREKMIIYQLGKDREGEMDGEGKNEKRGKPLTLKKKKKKILNSHFSRNHA